MSISPTDIDGYIDYHGKSHIFFEIKLAGTPVKLGQRIAMERICDDLNKVRPTIYIIATHNQVNAEIPIDVSGTLVTEYRNNKQWKTGNKSLDDFIVEWTEYIDAKE